jgi:hypothetical protein
MKLGKRKTTWLYVDGEKKLDVLDFAMSARMYLGDAKKALQEQYKDREIEFKVCL